MRRGCAVLAAVLLVLAAAGCDDAMWLEYHDDPYLANLARQGEQEVIRHINSASAKERLMALRILAGMAGEKRRQGLREDADRYDALIIRRYFVEKETEVKA